MKYSIWSLYLTLSILLGQQIAFCQSPEAVTDSLITKDRLSTGTAITGLSVITSGTFIALSQVWYADFPKTTFHTFDDSREWLGMDKLGHIYATQHLSELGFNIFNKTPMSPRNSALAGTVFGWSFQLGFELLDGRNEAWGFSFSDIASNTVGAGLFLSQELLWQRQFFRIKYSYSNSGYASFRPNILGDNFLESSLKDYNGQTYWLSGSPFVLMPSLRKLDWLCLSFGYSVDAKLHGDLNHYVTNNTIFQAQSEYVLSLDIDVDAMDINRLWLKKLLTPLRWIKIPFPAMVMTKNGVGFSPFYF